MRRALSLTAAFVAALALVTAASAGGGATFTDPTEGTAGSADIQTVTVQNNPSAHTVTFGVQVSNMPTITEDGAAIEIYIDADQNATTGEHGIECMLGLSKGGWYFLQWDGTKLSDNGLQLYPVTYNDGLLSMTMDQGSCSLSRTFSFWVSSYRGPDPQNPVEDDAPDSGLYSYTLSTVAPTPKKQVFVVNGAPRSGQSFLIEWSYILFSDGSSANLDGLSCHATLGGRRLAGAGSGGCMFAVPKHSHGKKLVVTATGSVQSGKKYTYRSTYVVR